MTRTPSIVLATVLGALAGCQGVSLPGVYRIDIQQGNVITQEQLAALERGMEKRKVRFLLGTPLVADPFNQDRWDYYYSLERRGEERVKRLVSVYFEDERLVRVGGDVLAAAGPIELPARKDEVVSVPPGYREDGLLAALTPAFLSRRPAAAAADAQTGGEPGGGQQDGSGIELSEEDQRYLRDLLAGFGRGARAQGEAADEPPAAAEGAAEQEEGILARWARRLGIGASDEQSRAAPAPDSGSAPPAR